jgi:hypothetical protein
VKRYKGTEYCLFFWDQASQTFVNVADNDKSVLISVQTRKGTHGKSQKIVLKLFDTNRYAPGPHPFTYGGQTRRQFVVTNIQTENILCYKFLNNYQLRSAAWVQSQAYKLRHHKNCNFDFFYINYDPKKLKTKHKWRDEWDSETMSSKDDEREQESEEEGDDQERKGEKAEDKKKKDGDKCGCCCHDGEQKHTKPERAKHGVPDDEDDIVEIPPRPPKTPVITGGGSKPIRPVTPPPTKKPEPKPPVKKPDPTPTPPPPPKEPGKGELNKEYGFYVERPFYVISMCGEKRYLDVIGRNVVVKTPNEFDSQVWYFDQRTKTIMNTLYKNKSLDIQNSGSTRNLQIWSTNGGWFQKFKYSQNYLKNVQDGRVIEIVNN